MLASAFRGVPKFVHLSSRFETHNFDLSLLSEKYFCKCLKCSSSNCRRGHPSFSHHSCVFWTFGKFKNLAGFVEEFGQLSDQYCNPLCFVSFCKYLKKDFYHFRLRWSVIVLFHVLSKNKRSIKNAFSPFYFWTTHVTCIPALSLNSLNSIKLRVIVIRSAHTLSLQCMRKL